MMYNDHHTPAESPAAKRESLTDLTKYAPPPKGPVMFPNFTGWSYIKATLFALVTLDGVFLTGNVFDAQVTHYAAIASLFLGALGTIVATLSGTAVGTPAVAKMVANRADVPPCKAPVQT